MLSIIIIDDQPSVLSGLKDVIKWDELNIEVKATAMNGREGFEKIKQYKPDIVITDIQMPIMDGIQMLEELSKIEIKPEVVILSGYGEFDYANRAMNYGVSEYILKPVLPATLVEIIKKAADRCNNKKLQQNQKELIQRQLAVNMPVITENFIKTLFFNVSDNTAKTIEQAKYLNINLNAECFRVICVEIDDYESFLGVLNEEEQQIIKLSIIECLKSHLEIGKEIISFGKRGAYGLLLNEADDTILLEKLKGVLEEVNQRYGISITAGVGDSVNDISKIASSYNQAYESTKYKFYFGNGKIIFFNDLIYTQRVTPVIEFFNREELTDGIKLRTKSKMMKCVENMFALMREHPYLSSEYLKVINHEIIDTAVSAVFSMGEKLPESLQNSEKRWKMIEQQETLENLELNTHEIFESIFENIGHMDANRNHRLIEEIINYVHNGYDKDISLIYLSKIIYMTPNYLGSVFYKSMGKSFNEYLTEYRIEKAKELLKTTDYRVYEIAEMVGYKTLDYFRRVFKQYTGQSPTNYSRSDQV